MSNGGWNTIESDAGVFTYLLENLGVKDVQFEELLSLDPDALAQLHPVYGVIFLFRVPTDTPARSATGRPLDGDFDHAAAEPGSSVFFAHQTIQNACATQALLSVLLNKVGSGSGSGSGDDQENTIDIGPTLRDFRDFAVALPPDFRGEVLSNSELIREVHNRFARSSPFADETQRAQPDPDDDDAAAYHFIAYTAVGATLYELDGLQPAPIRHGAPGQCATPEAFATAVMAVLQRRVARYGEAEIRFNLLAMCRDLRVRARETADAELLARELRKRRDWRFENALRRHNFVGLAGEVLKGVVAAKLAEGPADDAYRAWIDGAKEKTKKSVEERRKRGGGGEDVEMQG